MSRPTGGLIAKAEACIRMEARGEKADDILRTIFGLDPETAEFKEKNRCWQQMYRWRHHPDAQAIWEDEVRNVVRAMVPSAMNRIRQQIDDGNGWLANKAANDVVGLAKTTTVFASEEKAVNVHITGMPDLGSPDQDEG